MPAPSFNSNPADEMRRTFQDLDRRAHALGLTIDSLRTSVLGLETATKGSSSAMREMARIPTHVGHMMSRSFPDLSAINFGSGMSSTPRGGSPIVSRPFASYTASMHPGGPPMFPGPGSYSIPPRASSMGVYSLPTAGSAHGSLNVGKAATALGALSVAAGALTAIFFKLTGAASPQGVETVGKMFTILSAKLGTGLMPQLADLIVSMDDTSKFLDRNKAATRGVMSGITESAVGNFGRQAITGGFVANAVGRGILSQLDSTDDLKKYRESEDNARLRDKYAEAITKGGKTPAEARAATGYRPPDRVSKIPLEQLQTSTPKYGSVDDMYMQIQLGALKSSPLDQELKEIQNRNYITLQLILAELQESRRESRPAVN